MPFPSLSSLPHGIGFLAPLVGPLKQLRFPSYKLMVKEIRSFPAL
jgi:hypothetical protein